MMSMLQEQWERMKSQYQSQEAQNQYVLHTIPPPGMSWKFFEYQDMPSHVCLNLFPQPVQTKRKTTTLILRERLDQLSQ